MESLALNLFLSGLNRRIDKFSNKINGHTLVNAYLHPKFVKSVKRVESR